MDQYGYIGEVSKVAHQRLADGLATAKAFGNDKAYISLL